MFLMTSVSFVGYTAGSGSNGDDTSLPVASRYLPTTARPGAHQAAAVGACVSGMHAKEQPRACDIPCGCSTLSPQARHTYARAPREYWGCFVMSTAASERCRAPTTRTNGRTHATVGPIHHTLQELRSLLHHTLLLPSCSFGDGGRDKQGQHQCSPRVRM